MNKIYFALVLFAVISCREGGSGSGAVKKSSPDQAFQKENTSIIKELIAHSEWRIKSKVSQTLGKSCTDEEYLSFDKDSVTHSICVKGKLQTTKEALKLIQNDGQWKMIMAGREYTVTVAGNILMINNVNDQIGGQNIGKEFIGETNN